MVPVHGVTAMVRQKDMSNPWIVPRSAVGKALCLLTTCAACFGAQNSDNSQNTAELIQRLLQRVDQLERRVAELEGARVGVSPAAARAVEQTPSAGQQPPGGGLPHEHGTMIDTSTTGGGPSMKIAGFSDINFAASDQKGTHSGFNEGQFILHITSALSSKVTYFGELSMTARPDAGTGSPAAPGFNVEVERSIIRFDQSDRLKVSFGRYHTPISYWNTAFHHGSWLQTTASRPEMVQFGGSFIPVHFVGGLVEGAVPAGGLNLNYNFGIGNGRSSVISRSGDWGDINNNKAWLANIFVRPDKPFGLQVGGSVYRDLITTQRTFENREWIESAHVVWSKENPEFISEFFNVNHRPVGSSRDFNSQAWYAQFAYRLPVAERQWKPYYRYEYIHVPSGDAVFRSVVSNLSGSVLGVRYDISSFAAFKFEYRNQERPGLPRINAAWAQTSFTF